MRNEPGETVDHRRQAGREGALQCRREVLRVGHRFAVAGGPQFPFAADAVHALFRYSKGVPRLLNIIADRALLAAYVHEHKMVDKKLVSLAAKEILPTQNYFAFRRVGLWFAAMLMVTLLGFGIRHYFDSSNADTGVEHVVNS